jgi:hypothetical protein
MAAVLRRDVSQEMCPEGRCAPVGEVQMKRCFALAPNNTSGNRLTAIQGHIAVPMGGDASTRTQPDSQPIASPDNTRAGTASVVVALGQCCRTGHVEIPFFRVTSRSLKAGTPTRPPQHSQARRPQRIDHWSNTRPADPARRSRQPPHGQQKPY